MKKNRDAEDTFTKAKEEHTSKKELVEKICKDQGLPAESAAVAAKNMLKTIGTSRGAYHRGDYNGGSCSKCK